MTENKGPRDDRWYLPLMAPNTKGDKFAWLDPTSIYINGRAFHDLLDDLCAELDPDTIDVVAGLDAMGFVLGAGIATRIGKGFLPIRKAGKLPVATIGEDYALEYGEARLDQAKELIEEGVPLMPLPFRPKQKLT